MSVTWCSQMRRFTKRNQKILQEYINPQSTFFFSTPPAISISPSNLPDDSDGRFIRMCRNLFVESRTSKIPNDFVSISIIIVNKAPFRNCPPLVTAPTDDLDCLRAPTCKWKFSVNSVYFGTENRRPES